MSDRPPIALEPGNGVSVSVNHDDVAILSHGPNAMSLFDTEGHIVDVNDRWVDLYGYTREEARTMTVRDVSAEPEVTREAIRQSESSGGTHVPLRWHKRRDGTVFPVELTAGTLRIGQRVLMYAVMHDISERLRVERELLRSEARFRALTNSLPVGVLVQREGTVLYANPTLTSMLGMPSGTDIIGTQVMDWVHPDERPLIEQRIAAMLRDGQAAPAMEERLLRTDGSVVWAENSAIPIELDDGPAVLAMVRDIGERKKMEAQLVVADRLASLGRLAASVGHEINNPLAYVIGNVELLRREVSKIETFDEATRADLLERLAVLDEGAGRVRDIVRDLKSLSRSDPETVTAAIDLHRMLDVAANMADHVIRHRAQLVREYGAPVMVCAPEGRIAQVFLNLLINAGQAIGEGMPKENEIRITTLRVGDRVVVEVRDTGAGIAPEHIDRIFEPFFTTQESQGTGLGLSISHAIVSSLGGTIEVGPNGSRGTCFRVTLPCLEPETSPTLDAPRDPGPGARAPVK